MIWRVSTEEKQVNVYIYDEQEERYVLVTGFTLDSEEEAEYLCGFLTALLLHNEILINVIKRQGEK